TPFYAEMGGQIGDTGIITTDTGKMEVLETKAPLPEMYVHRGKIVEGVLKSEQEAIAKIDEARREEIAKNHTATHLLHWALRKVLGSHVRQGGSLVAPNRLRFDFTHFQALSPEEIEKIERLVNEKIAQNYPVRTYQTSLDFAKESGALAFFGEKYGDVVRILEIGDFSKELCGGTHVGRTSEINMVKIISEASIGANLRRIEAISSVRAWDYFNREDRALKGAASILGVKKDEVVKGASNLLSSLKEKEKQIENLQLVLRKEKVREILASARQINNVRVVMEEVGAQNMEYLRALVDSLKEKLGRGIIILAATSKGKALLVAAVTPNLIRDGFNAEKILDSIAPVIGGGGGGRADLAQAGGKKPEKLPQAFEKALSYIEDSLTGIKNN
ncbi:MAG TPA: DHHA1 domain-containing protein, partial [Candidatus Subteraquimicrobiales bacterium]